ncbi:MAG: cytochrome b/b6 domain-containing protein, partial [gamma proteobacterium symbiont of Lucinoma myriamae]|nr:cytochrome b/b6 domain-containing protein [gamma proteobacterium symbiont of Lucinoma myriamae]MCU7833536.1 cytochrome b/b6 domain-containing protein [gamma proteobacterium symbiont of Lucinoma myriamae]
MNTIKLVVFKRFERMWHWSQMALIFTLLFSGAAIYGVNPLISFADAVTLHTWAAIILIVIWLFATFWLFTTGQWRHYPKKRSSPCNDIISSTKLLIIELFFSRLE